MQAHSVSLRGLQTSVWMSHQGKRLYQFVSMHDVQLLIGTKVTQCKLCFIVKMCFLSISVEQIHGNSELIFKFVLIFSVEKNLW